MKTNGILRKTAIFLLAVVSVVCFALFNALYGASALSSSDFTNLNGEWVFETDGASPATENAVMQYNEKLSGDFKVSFDVAFSSVYQSTTDFQVALFANNGDADMSYAYTVAISTIYNTVSVVNNTANSAVVMNIVDIGKTLRDDTAHTLSVISYGNKLYVSFDGISVVSASTLAVNEGYLNISASSILDKVSNFAYQTSYVPTAEEMENNNLLDVVYNFENDADLLAFESGWGSWKIEDGAFRPSTAYHHVHLADKLLLYKENVKLTVSLDFKTDSLFTLSFPVTTTSSQQGNGLTVQMNTSGTIVNNSAHNSYNAKLNTTTSYADNTWHTLTIEFKNGYADMSVDGSVLYEGYDLEYTDVYLFIQGKTTTTYIDNLRISETQFILDTSFNGVSDTSVFDSKYLGWKVNGGKYYANGSWATTYYNELLDLTKPLEINFDFYLTTPSTAVFDNATQFNIGLINFNGNAVSDGFSAHFFNNATHKIYMSTLNWDFGNPANGNAGVWIADDTQNCFDGKEHHFTIKFKKGYAYFELDGRSVYTPIQVRTTPAYLIFQATDTSYYIDNLSIVEGIDYSKDLEFSYSTDADEFGVGYLGWTVNTTNGTLKPKNAWATTYLKDYITQTGKNTISLDFVATNSTKIGFVEYVDGATTGKGLDIFFEANGTYLYKGATSADGLVYKDTTKIFTDGLTHNLVITVTNGSATFAVDGVTLFPSQPIGVNIAQLFLQMASGSNYIDNLKITKTIEVTETVLEEVAIEENQVLLGYQVVGGRYDGFYKVGEKIEVIDGMTVKPVIVGFYMHYGVQARLKDGGGLRWQSIMTMDDYNAILDLDINAKFGTIITSKGSEKSVDIPLVNGGNQDGENFVWNGALTDIKQTNYERLIKGTGYVTVTYANGETATFYAKNDNNERSYFEVMETLYNKVSDVKEGVYTTAVTNLEGKTVYTSYSVSAYNFIKTEYSKMKEYLGK